MEGQTGGVNSQKLHLRHVSHFQKSYPEKLSVFHTPRVSRLGGGVACLVSSKLSAKKLETPKTKSFEHIAINLESAKKMATVIVVYRPEPSKSNRYNISEFFEEFTQLLAQLSCSNKEILIAGDFNFHYNKPANINTIRLCETFDMFNLLQHVQGPTHKSGNTLDLVLTRSDSSIVSDFETSDLNSDHNCILFNLDLGPKKQSSSQLRYRRTRSINLAKFKTDLNAYARTTACDTPSVTYLNTLVNRYNSLSDVLDKHAPLVTARAKDRSPTPWTRSDIKSAKREKRSAERKWRQTRNASHFEIFKEKRNAFNNLLKRIRSDDLSQKIQTNKGNSKALFKVINASLNRKQDSPLPHHDNDSALANEFAQFFDNKIQKLRSKLDSQETRDPIHNPTSNLNNNIDHFECLTHEQVKIHILRMPTKHCNLDPLPTWLVKECLAELLPLLTLIVNTSMKLGIMPCGLKHGLIKPLLKKSGMSPTKENYRPVSNLSFLGKLIESVVIEQFLNHLSMNHLHDERQSAYKKYHSTETLLTKVHNDIMSSMSKGEITMLVLLDLSAAFDTIDHVILTNRLQYNYGITGTALNWFKSYLSDRTQSVTINGTDSDNVALKYGVPQGSKLGPILFNSYIAPLSNIARRYKIRDQKYADDEQLILSFKPNLPIDCINATKLMEGCIKDIRSFLHQNKLCNNSDKTEFLLIGTPSQLCSINT